MKKLLCLLLAACLLSGCTAIPTQSQAKQYTATFLTLFDTVTTIKGSAPSEEAFTATVQQIHDQLQEYHQLFDIYEEYEGIHNLKTVNDHAGGAPVQVDGRIIDLLLDCKQYYQMTGGKVNVAMGSVLRLWHEARTDAVNDPLTAALPDLQALQEAALHTNLDAVVIDETASTVQITDAMVQLDVGAIAKGWAAQKVAEIAPEGMLISVGGNVCATGAKDEKGTAWVIGVQDPDNTSSYLHTLYLTRGSIVTSGDYQRCFYVGNQRYHHIIDPVTLMPSDYWRSVSVICPDSAMADALSTALFLLPLEEGKALLAQCRAEAMWVDGNGPRYYSSGFEKMIKT